MDMDIEKIAALACLSFSEEERQALEREMEEILSFARSLPDWRAEEDGSAEEVNVRALRGDTVAPSLSRESLLAAAPARTERYITVPRVLSEGKNEE